MAKIASFILESLRLAFIIQFPTSIVLSAVPEGPMDLPVRISILAKGFLRFAEMAINNIGL